MSTNFNAGTDSSDVVLSYGEETVWGTTPAVPFKQVRMTGEGFMEKKQRARPEEINPDGFAAHAITQQVSAEGSLKMAFSYGTYDDLLAGALNGNWGAALAVDAVANDIVVSSTLGAGTVHGFTSATAGKFSGIVAGQWIRTFGFTNAANNGYFRVIGATANELQVAGTAPVAEVPAAGTQSIRGKVLRNGVSIHTFTFQKQLASALFLMYNGCYVNDSTLTANVGNFMEGNFGFLAKSEDKATVNQSTGLVTAAPTGRVVDTVAGFQQLEVNDTPIAAVAQAIEVNIAKNNARAQYGLGNAACQGMARGTLEVKGKLSVYFTDFALYDLYKSEADQLVTFRAVDNLGAGYIITVPAATLMNPQVVAGGPDSDVVSEFELEGNGGTGIYNGVVMQIDKLPAAPGDTY